MTSILVGACTAGASPSAPSATPEPSLIPTPSAPVAPTNPPTRTPDPSRTPAPPTTWSATTTTGPAPAAREDHTWTVDPTGTTAYLFGGRSGSRAFGDLWAYDLATDTWREVSTTGESPPSRFGHEAVWVDGRGLIVFAGQASATAFFNDLWSFDAAAARWTRLPNGGATPVPRYGSCSGIGRDGRLWVSHGFTEDGTRFSDTRAYSFSSGEWEDETPAGRVPVQRCLHGCWFAADGAFVLYAGQTTGVEALADLWRLDDPGSSAAAWTRIEGDLPADRNLYAFARHGEATIVVGGRGSGATYRSDSWVFADDGSVATLQLEGDVPPGRSGATLIDDVGRGRMLLFGGKTGSGPLADLWALELP